MVGTLAAHFPNMLLSFSLADTSSAAMPTSLAECPASGTTCIYNVLRSIYFFPEVLAVYVKRFLPTTALLTMLADTSFGSLCIWQVKRAC